MGKTGSGRSQLQTRTRDAQLGGRLDFNLRNVPADRERVERLAKGKLATLSRNQGASGDWLYEVSPDAHQVCLLDPHWRPTDESFQAIRGAIAAAFLQFERYKNEIQLIKEEWNGHFEYAKGRSASDLKDHPG